MNDTRLEIECVETFVYRVPLQNPVRTSFGTMLDRPAVLLRLTDRDGAIGWGEIWCNFPAVGAEHRARLVESALAPFALSRTWASPSELFAELSRTTTVLAIQSGEPGPIAHAIAGIDIAAWDLIARRARQPLWRLLGGTSDRIAVYASGLNPDQPERLAERRCDEGHRAFKLKVGFGRERDLRNLENLRRTIGGDGRLMVDANQAWTTEEAIMMRAAMAPFDLGWLEEPLRADRPWSEWRRLIDAENGGGGSGAGISLAAGENLAGHVAFDQAIDAGVLGVIQPDLAKWGGFSGCLPVARRILAAGIGFCPHFLGAGIGLRASGHLLAAAGGNGLLEIDANENPLRTLLWGSLDRIDRGFARLGDDAGLGVEPGLEALEGWRVTGG